MGKGSIGEPSEIWRIMEEWILTDKIQTLLSETMPTEEDMLKALRLLRVLTLYSLYPGLTMPRMFDDRDIRTLLGVNEYQGTLWFRKENAEEMFHAFFLASVMDIEIEKGSDSPSPSFENDVIDRYRTLRVIVEAMEQSGFKLQTLVEEI
jgi:hypothetical protein